jgi:hypothetical protein
MSKIQLAGEYTKVSSFGWIAKPKPQPLERKERVKRNRKSTWAKGGMGSEAIYSGDLLARIYEDTEKQLERDKYPGQEDFEQIQKRMGQLMHSSEFIRKVLSLNKNLIYEDSKWNKGHGAFYLAKGQEKEYTNACFKIGWIPEWSQMIPDTSGRPTRDGLTYGWRTVLQRLVQRKCLTMQQVNRTFGLVTHGDLRGKNWAMAVNQFS